MPELVSLEEISDLKFRLRKCEDSSALILHIGDCAEAFEDCISSVLRSKLRTYENFMELLASLTGRQTILIGRIAGQFSKPRTDPYEMIDGKSVPVYRGDLINSFDPSGRTHDPQRMVDGYYYSASVLNYIRSQRYSSYVSHEGLVMTYESAMTRSKRQVVYNSSAHMLWLGERTRKLGYAHVEYFSSIENPVGLKVGPGCNLQELVHIIRMMNEKRERGKLLIFTRLGAQNVSRELPSIVQAVQDANVPHIWIVDPMHGNTYKNKLGVKTRNIEDIAREVKDTVSTLISLNECIGGISLEASFDEVTECIGLGVKDEDLGTNYASLCDPRLNPSQTEYILRQIKF